VRLGLRHSVKVEGRLNFVQTTLEPLGRGAVYPGEAIERHRLAWLADARIRVSSRTRTRSRYRCRGCRRSTDPQRLHIADRFLP
jgi:hypothetical protein